MNAGVHGAREGVPAFTLLNELNDAVVVADARFEPPGPLVVYANDACEAACGRSRSELQGFPLAVLYPELEQSTVLNALARHCRSQGTWRRTGGLSAASGERVEVSWRITPVFDGSAVDHLVCVAVDQEGSREAEGRLRDFAEIAADWFWETDENLVVTYVSSAHRQITSIPDSEVIGRTREELFQRGIYRADDPATHLRTLSNHWDSMIEYSVIREDGNEIIIHDRASPFFDHRRNFRGYRGVGRDVSEQKRLTRRIAWQATCDPLTGCLNRREFERCLDEAVDEAGRGRGEHVLCFSDLDKFKLLNDTHGHPAGDYLLKQIVSMLQADIGERDLLGRMGGDEFGILLRNTTVERAWDIARRLTNTIARHEFEWEERTFTVAMSMGLVPINSRTSSSSELLARADSACYRAKTDSRNRVYVSDEREAARLRTYTEILRSLSSGPTDLSSNFQLVGQPIRPIDPDRTGPPWYEVLLRLVGEDGRFYRPYEFIRLAEQYGKMPMIERWIIESAVSAHARLVQAAPEAVLSINLAETSLSDTHLQALMSRLLDEYALHPANLCFEIREHTVLTDFQRTVSLAESLAGQGYRVALDEFGSGPASFACLKHLPVRYLKLYGELVRGMHRHDTDIAIIDAINKLSRQLGLTLIAVQVETVDTAQALKKIGVPLGQGDALAATQPLAALLSDLGGPYDN